MNMSETIGKLAEALTKVEFKPIKKKAINPHFKSKYAPLDEVIDCTRDGLKEQGLAIVQLPNGDSLRTVLMHTSGEWIAADTALVTEGVRLQGPQGYGSAVTYARRYGLSAILNVASEDDDDGNVAQESAKKVEPKKATKKTAKQIEEMYVEYSIKAENEIHWQNLGLWLDKMDAPKKLKEQWKNEFELWKQSFNGGEK